jgi:hypothetical protein
VLALLAVPAYWLYPSFGSKLPCFHPEAFVLCFAFGTLALLHLLRIFGYLIKPPSKLNTPVGPVGVEKDANAVELFHPSYLSRQWWPWLVAVSVIALCVAIFLTLGRVRTEVAPIVDRFWVKYIGTDIEEPFVRRAIVPLQAEQEIRIRAETLCPDPRCRWNSGEGARYTTEGCAIVYRASRQQSLDFVDLEVTTRCGTQSHWTGLFIQVTNSAP